MEIIKFRVVDIIKNEIVGYEFITKEGWFKEACGDSIRLAGIFTGINLRRDQFTTQVDENKYEIYNRDIIYYEGKEYEILDNSDHCGYSYHRNLVNHKENFMDDFTCDIACECEVIPKLKDKKFIQQPVLDNKNLSILSMMVLPGFGLIIIASLFKIPVITPWYSSLYSYYNVLIIGFFCIFLGCVSFGTLWARTFKKQN